MFKSHYRVEQKDIGTTIFKLEKPHFLVESKGFSFGDRLNLCSIPSCPTVMREFPRTEQEFYNRINYWQQWRTVIGYSERVITIIPAETHYLVLKRYSSGFNRGPYEFIRLLDGPYTGKETYLEFP